MLALHLEQVRDFEDVAGDLEVAVAVHGVRGSSVKVGQREREPRDWWLGLQLERVWLNSWNSNSYSERGQHRGTRRGGSR
ncbi:hypothetical protein GCM10010270_42890 [Streptomyces violaceus]|nr:hypothetical protein GCM10010270_42890 [Streptomyces janthinus]